MIRGSCVLVCSSLMAALGGCSLALDFSDKKIPIDAAPPVIDAPYTEDECNYKEPNETAAAAAPITSADVGPAAICPNDVDFYKFTVPTGTTSVSIKILFTNSPTGDLDLKLFNADGSQQLAASLGFTDNEQIVCPGASPFCDSLDPADYIFEVFPAVTGDVNHYGIDLELTPPT